MFETDESQWPLVVVRSTESGSPNDDADEYVALWERRLADGGPFRCAGRRVCGRGRS